MPGPPTKPNVRPQVDKFWVWGCTVQGRPDLFLFRVLDHPEDAYANRPRGKEEIIKCLDLIPLQKDMTLVTDGWRGTLAAVNEIKRRNGWGPRSLRHEKVIHRNGEVVNSRGYSTNSIENRWSVLKRWLKKKCGGKLPPIRSRDVWKNTISEFTYRKMASRGQSIDDGHTFIVPTKLYCQHVSSLM